ncbi:MULTISPECIES: hypothetical protein [Streptacidiphilus]|uniref:Uncharacterized protein n=2 Tax=Streptacidiphilus TaxID=228398 RepID=A0ABV6UPT8_9ACTN|nr:hypothetical protein [Streptacidiphilus jeojiense]
MAQISRVWFDTDLSHDDLVLRIAWVPQLTSNYGGSGLPSSMIGLQVRVLPVSPTERAATREILRRVALPQLDAWAAQALCADETWRLMRHHRCWYVADGQLTHQDG